jgi:TonB family protein
MKGSETGMPRRYLAACLLFVLACGGESVQIEAQTREERELKSFYIVTHVVSDAAPFRYEYVLDVKPQGKDVHVLEIRLGAPRSTCPGITVKAAEHVITNASPKRIARADLCSLNVESVDSAVKAAGFKGVASIEDTASYSIVAMCGKTEKVFELPYPETVDFKKLKRAEPETAKLWELYHDILQRWFGSNFSFYDVSPAQDAAYQGLGAQIVPAMKSGIYSRGFANGSHLEVLLKDYSGPVQETDPGYVEFVGRAPARLLKYRLPNYPPLARQTRIVGEVHLTVSVDSQTGIVKDVQVNSGHPLLRDSAVVAVREWKFEPGTPLHGSAEIALKFSLDCLSP